MVNCRSFISLRQIIRKLFFIMLLVLYGSQINGKVVSGIITRLFNQSRQIWFRLRVQSHKTQQQNTVIISWKALSPFHTF